MSRSSAQSVVITAQDEARLEALLEARASKPGHSHSRAILAFLSEQLADALIVAPHGVPGNVVTMHSRVLVRDETTGHSREITLVYPGREDSDRGWVSVLSPAGSALLGLGEGQSATWKGAAGGDSRTLTVLKVVYQPEAQGHFAL